MKGYVYDIECYPNYFCVAFIPLLTKTSLIAEYCKADWRKQYDKKVEIREQLGIEFFVVYTNDKGDVHNDIESLRAFVKSCDILIGYNSRNYDDLLLDYIEICKFTKEKGAAHITKSIHRLGSAIIEYQGYNYRWDNSVFKNFHQPYKSADLIAMLFEKTARKSLKQVAINLNWYRVQDLPIEPNSIIEDEQIDDMYDYCLNDVLITHALYWNKIEEVRTRVVIGENHGINLLNSNRSNIGDRLMVKDYAEQTGLRPIQFKKLRTERRLVHFKDIIDEGISFNHPILIAFLNKLKGTTLVVGGTKEQEKEGYTNKFEEKLIFDDCIYTFATGGLHSQDRPGILQSTDDILYRDADVTSYYPYGIYYLEVCPKHLDKAVFLNIVITSILERVYNKEQGLKYLAEALKIKINSGLFGKLGFEWGWLFDLKAMYTVTINCQLYLLKFIEMLSEGHIKTVSANTDGVVAKIHKSQLEEYNKICKAWCEWSKFNLEYTDYIKYVRTTVNDYMCLKDDGSIDAKTIFNDKLELDDTYDELSDEELDSYVKKNSKQKGDFIDDVALEKGFNTPIIAKCLQAYFLKDIPIDTTLSEANNIYEFCLSQKTGNVFLNEFHTIKDGKLNIEILQKNIRYYVSVTGGAVIKKYKDKPKRISILAKKYVTIINDYVEYDDFAKYNINYKYYKTRIMDIVNKVYLMNTKDIKGTKSKSGISGTMFDNL